MSFNPRGSFSREESLFNSRIGRSEFQDQIKTNETGGNHASGESLERSYIIPGIRDINQERALHCLQRKITDTIHTSAPADLYHNLTSNLEHIARGNSLNDQKREKNIINLENTWNIIKRDLSSEKRNGSPSPNKTLSARFLQLTKPASFIEKADPYTEPRCENHKTVALRSIPHSKISLEIAANRAPEKKSQAIKECSTPKNERKNENSLFTSQKLSTPTRKTIDIHTNESMSNKIFTMSESCRLERTTPGKAYISPSERLRLTDSDLINIQRRKNSEELGFNPTLALSSTRIEGGGRISRENESGHRRKKSGGSVEPKLNSYVCYPSNASNRKSIRSPERRDNLTSSKTFSDAINGINLTPQKIMANSQVLNLRCEATDESEPILWRQQAKVSLDLRNSVRKLDLSIAKQISNETSLSRRLDTSPRNKNTISGQSSTLRQDSEDHMKCSAKSIQKIQNSRGRKQNPGMCSSNSNTNKGGKFVFSQKAFEYAESNLNGKKCGK